MGFSVVRTRSPRNETPITTLKVFEIYPRDSSFLPTKPRHPSSRPGLDPEIPGTLDGIGDTSITDTVAGNSFKGLPDSDRTLGHGSGPVPSTRQQGPRRFGPHPSRPDPTRSDPSRLSLFS